LNKNSPWAHTELELSVFGVAGKLGENPVHGCLKKRIKKKLLLLRSCSKRERPKFGFKEF
jgi:hypothetical protein